MTDFQLSSKSGIKKAQLAHLLKKAKESGGGSEELLALYDQNPGLPLFSPHIFDKGQLPFREEIIENMTDTVADFGILKKEHDTASRFLVDSFNTVHSERKRITARIQGLNNLVGDMLLLAGENNQNVVYFKESFQDATSFDTAFALDNVVKGHISPGEGILTLGRKSTRNLAETARVSQVNGNGEAGIGHVARKFATVNREGVRTEAFHFLNEYDSEKNADASLLLDNRPDTLFEYQLVNVPQAFKTTYRNYDFGWAKGAPAGETLRLKLVVELKQLETINWISLNPYYASNAAGKLNVYSIQTSADGFDYEPLYTDKQILSQTLNNLPQTYQLDALFDGSNEAANALYTGQGVWNFPQRQARFIEFVLDQEQAYPEIIGQEVYYRQNDEASLPVQIPEPAELAGQEPGSYIRTVDGRNVVFMKTIEATTAGWRYAIGVRDIHIMQYQFEEKSFFVSKRYETNEPISKVMLYANEIIPQSYLDIVSKNNDWITYEVSFDDTNWFPISPMHHEPLNDVFSPKILEVNSAEVDLTAAFQIHKARIKTDGPAHQVRLKVTLSRPKGAVFEDTTPILEDVALKIEKKGVL